MITTKFASCDCDGAGQGQMTTKLHIMWLRRGQDRAKI